MPDLRIYSLFISHVWRNSDNSEYYRLEKLLKEASNFYWRNYSVPEHDPLGTKTDEELREALDLRIRPASCFLVISGMYVNYRKWIQTELDIAESHGKPVVGIIPWGQERTPYEVQNTAKEMVGWNTDSIVAAVRRWSL